MKILITGGHLSPALSIIDELTTKTDIIFVGRKFSSLFDRSISLEFQEITRRKIPFFNLEAGRLTRILSFRSLLHILFFPFGFIMAYIILNKVHPDRVLSFGGYIGFPVCFVSWLMRIPVVIHEQTIRPGLANRIIALFAKKICISFPESSVFFPAKKTVLTGNPVKKNIFSYIKKSFYLKKWKPVLYLTGGTLGSHSLNHHIKNILPGLLSRFQVIHQTGNVREFGDFQTFVNIRTNFPLHIKESYIVREHFFEDEIGYVYSQTDIVIGRSGANTITELIALKIPSVLVPLPWSSNQEQLLQAKFLKTAGVAEIFDQSHSSDELLLLVEKIYNNLTVYKSNFTKFGAFTHSHAASTIAAIVLQETR